MKPLFRVVCLLATLCLGLAAVGASPAAAADKKTFKVGYTVYIGFMPMAWMKESGVLKKWADKYGIEIEMIQANDYVGSINQFIAGDLDAVGVAGMDALTMPAAGGVDTSLFLLTDYSNGNDIVMSKTAKGLPDLVGKEVYLLQYSVSHYLLNRGLILSGVADPATVKTVNISDAEISAAYVTQDAMENAVSWKPLTEDMLKAKGSHMLFDSSKIPGEIMDTFIGKTDVLKKNPEFGKALIGAWYEAMAVLSGGGEAAAEMKKIMASAMGADVAALQSQIDTTFFFTKPADAHAFMTADSTVTIWDNVRRFCFEQGLFGQGATSVDSIGIEVKAGSLLGDTKNVKLRVDASFTKLAADGAL